MSARTIVENKPSVFLFQDSRVYLSAIYKHYKFTTLNFSYRRFSAMVGFKSPNFLKLVIDGQRNLTESSVRKINLALKHSPAESAFFLQMVELTQAQTPTDRLAAVRAMSKSKVFRDLHPLNQAQMDYYQKWYAIPIREMVSSPSFREDPKWIAKKLGHGVTKEQVNEALKTLLLLGLIQRNEHGTLVQSQRHVTTGHEIDSSVVAAFHREMIRLAGESIDATKRYRRDISGSTILISESTYQHLRTLIQNFRQSLLAESESSLGPGARVYQVNFQIFPLTDDLSDPSPEEDTCKKAS